MTYADVDAAVREMRDLVAVGEVRLERMREAVALLRESQQRGEALRKWLAERDTEERSDPC